MSDKNTLYGGLLSYFTGKARAYLKWKGVEYEEKLATASIYGEVIIPRLGYPMIPVLITKNDQTIQDTTELIDHFEQAQPSPGIHPAGVRQRLVSHLLELYGDEWLVIPAMHYRWAHNRDFAYSEFGKVVLPEAAPAQQYEAGKKAATAFEGAVPMLGATPEMASAIEASYEALLDDLQAHFMVHDYLLGTKPCAGDFGLIGPLFAHQYRDPFSGELMKRRAPAVVDWVLRMQEPPAPGEGAFIDGDKIPDSLLPILTRMMSEQGPCLSDLVARLSAWRSENADADIPRAISMHSFTMEGETGQRLVFPYTQWMLQRALAHIEQVDRAFLMSFDGAFLKDLVIENIVRRENHRLKWA